LLAATLVAKKLRADLIPFMGRMLSVASRRSDCGISEKRLGSTGENGHLTERSDAGFLPVSLLTVSRQGGSVLSHGIPLEFQAVSVVDETVQDGIRQSRVLEPLMPGWYRRLAGQQG